VQGRRPARLSDRIASGDGETTLFRTSKSANGPKPLSRTSQGQRIWLGWIRSHARGIGKAPYAPIFQWVFGSDWDWRSFDFDRQFATFDQKLAGTLNATSPDIDTFRAHGHRLLMYHGWSDWLVAPEESIDYYNSVLTRDRESHSSARLEPIDNSFRLFMVPGMAHCGGGPGPDAFRRLGCSGRLGGAWNRTGQDHRQQVAALRKWRIGKSAASTMPVSTHRTVSGSGSVNDASSFVCTDPNPIVR